MNIRTCLIFICFGFFTAAHSQNDSAWYSFIKMAGIEFKKPDGYIEKHKPQTFYPNLGKSPVFFMTKLYAEDSSVMIGCHSMPFEWLQKSIEVAKWFNQVYDPNTDYLSKIKNFTASDSSLVQRFSKKITRKRYHADDAGMFTLKFKNSKLVHYAFCKVLFIHKKDRGFAMLFYFYDDEKKLTKSIQQTSGIIRFSR